MRKRHFFFKAKNCNEFFMYKQAKCQLEEQKKKEEKERRKNFTVEIFLNNYCLCKRKMYLNNEQKFLQLPGKIYGQTFSHNKFFSLFKEK